MTRRRPVVLTERQVIADLLRPLIRSPVALDLADDVAFWAHPESRGLVMTCDALACDVHFLSDTPASCVAEKSVAVNISDLVSKGACPRFALLSLACPSGSGEWLRGFVAGLSVALTRHEIALVGGDTVRLASGGPVISVTMLGTPVREHEIVRRSGARIGDWVALTGDIGAAWVGLMLARGELQDRVLSLGLATSAREAYERPTVDVRQAQAVAQWCSSACDVSDGLMASLSLLAQHSHVGIALHRSRIPLHSAARRVLRWGLGRLTEALTHGDDYVIACTIPQRHLADAVQSFAEVGVGLRFVGRVCAGHCVRWSTDHDQEPANAQAMEGGFGHVF